MNGSLFRISFSPIRRYHTKTSVSFLLARQISPPRLVNEYTKPLRPYVVSQPSHRANLTRAGDEGRAEEERKRENVGTSHSRFIAEAKQTDSWEDFQGSGKIQEKGGISQTELKESEAGRGKLSPTSTHLFKLMLPLPSLLHPRSKQGSGKEPLKDKTSAPTVFLLHPSQPLSHVSRLIQASLPVTQTSLRLPSVTFESVESEDDSGKRVQWSDSTDVGDFVKEAARGAEFLVVVTPDERGIGLMAQSNDGGEMKSPSQVTSQESPHPVEDEPNGGPFAPMTIPVTVPSFEDRTRFLRRRLEAVRSELKGMQDLKNTCDQAAHKGAKRLAVGGFAILVTYWVAVFRLTFFTDLGWDFMEPVTYLTEFLFILAGYIWFLRQGREVSYSSILNRSVSSRRQNLYTARGLDIERWAELVTDEKALRKEIERIRDDYDAGWKKNREDSINRYSHDGSQNQPSKKEKDESILDNTLTGSSDDSNEGGVDESKVVEKRQEQIRREEEVKLHRT